MDAAALARVQAAWPQLQPLQQKFLAALYVWQDRGKQPVSNKRLGPVGFTAAEGSEMNKGGKTSMTTDLVNRGLIVDAQPPNYRWKLADAALAMMNGGTAAPAPVAQPPAAAPPQQRAIAVPRQRMDTSADVAAPAPPQAAPPPAPVIPPFEPVDTSMPFVLPLNFPLEEFVEFYFQGMYDVAVTVVGLVEQTCTVKRTANGELVFKGRVNNIDTHKYIDPMDEELLVEHGWTEQTPGSRAMRVTDLGRRVAEIWYQQRERGLLFDVPDSWEHCRALYEWPVLHQDEFDMLQETTWSATDDDTVRDVLTRKSTDVAFGDIVYSQRMGILDLDVYPELHTHTMDNGAKYKYSRRRDMMFVRMRAMVPDTWADTLRAATSSLADLDANKRVTGYQRFVEMAANVTLSLYEENTMPQGAQYEIQDAGLRGIAQWQESVIRHEATATTNEIDVRTSDVTRLIFLKLKTGPIPLVSHADDMPAGSLSFAQLSYLRDLTLVHCRALESIQTLPETLRALTIQDCPALRSLSPTHSLAHMHSLLYITITNTDDWLTPQWGLDGSSSAGVHAWPPQLRKLHLREIAGCTAMAPLPSTLVSLSLVMCNTLQVPQRVGYVQSLRQLDLSGVAEPVYLLNAPFRSLRCLRISQVDRIEPSPPETFSLLYKRAEQVQNPRNGLPCRFAPFFPNLHTQEYSSLAQWFQRDNPLVWRTAMHKAIAAKNLPANSSTHVVMQHIYQFMRRASAM